MAQVLAWLLTAFQLLFLNVVYGEWNIAQPPVPPVHTPGNSIAGDSSLSPSVLYAAEVNNVVQGYFNDANRNRYIVRNAHAVLDHDLASGKRASLYTPCGAAYLRDTMDVFYTAGGRTFYAADSMQNGRSNSIRFGIYYIESHIRDLNFNRASGGLFWADKIYHVYGDRLYQEMALYASQATTALEGFGLEIRIPVDDVDKYEIGEANSFFAFDIKDVGVVGFIIPSDGSTGEVRLTEDSGNYVLRQYANFTPGTGINNNREEGGHALNSVRFGNRIYTDRTHSFDGIRAAAAEERSPITDISTTGGNSNAQFIEYDALRGAYTFHMDGMSFNQAWERPDFRFEAPMTFLSDTDRDIYVRTHSNQGGGNLEAAAILDGTGRLTPIPVQVCKNFQGDIAEHFYSPFDWAYSDSFFPLRLKQNKELNLTVLNLYQNWGRHPLKQVSSIEFHITYYHLSTGVTESNCIAPYFVFGRDGWVLPDFRTASGNIWAEQPQFNSVGRLRFVNYQRSWFRNMLGEYRASRIDSVGLSYADITTHYTSDCGSYDYTLRHVEFPQTDENRTYYTLDLTFNRGMAFRNFRRDFELFSFDGRHVRYRQAGWLNEDNQPQSMTIQRPFLGLGMLVPTRFITLGNQNPYFGFFDIPPEWVEHQAHDCNFALIVKHSDITLGGEAWDGNFAFKLDDDGTHNFGALTLDARRLEIKAGDRIRVDFILLPWGVGDETADINAQRVREDSAVAPLALDIIVGREIPDAYLPVVESVENAAQFVLSGGGGVSALRVNGFASLKAPVLERKIDGAWEPVELAGPNGGDGYTVFYNPATGLYDFAFVVETPGTAVEYRCVG